MDLQLSGKRALVTGSSAGIGAEIARVLAREGAAVAVHGRRSEAVAATASAIRDAGGSAVEVLGDLTTDEDAEKVVADATRELGGLDIVVNNAGEFHARGWMETTPVEWLSLYDANVVSMVRVIRAAAPAMAAQGWGRIVQVGSLVGAQPLSVAPEYAAAKAAVINLTASLTKELSGTGVTVNTVSPGTIMTAGSEVWFRETLADGGHPVPEDRQDLSRAVVQHLIPNPSGRVGTPEEVGELVAFVASPLAGYVNGANLRIDGGSAVAVN